MVDHAITLPQLLETRHANIPIYLLLMTPGAKFIAARNTPEGDEMRRQHLLYLWELEEAGKLLGCGPRDAGLPTQEGMGLLLAGSREEAEEIARNEPYAKAGWRTNRIASWRLNEGVAVDFVRRILAAQT